MSVRQAFDVYSLRRALISIFVAGFRYVAVCPAIRRSRARRATRVARRRSRRHVIARSTAAARRAARAVRSLYYYYYLYYLLLLLLRFFFFFFFFFVTWMVCRDNVVQDCLAARLLPMVNEHPTDCCCCV
jgi:hypothetical protein